MEWRFYILWHTLKIAQQSLVVYLFLKSFGIRHFELQNVHRWYIGNIYWSAFLNIRASLLPLFKVPAYGLTQTRLRTLQTRSIEFERSFRWVFWSMLIQQNVINYPVDGYIVIQNVCWGVFFHPFVGWRDSVSLCRHFDKISLNWEHISSQNMNISNCFFTSSSTSF